MSAHDLGIDGIAGLEAVARGGNAVIYRGHQPSMDRYVAVKVLIQTDETVRRRFDRERKAMGRLSRHPGVVTLYETGFTSDGRPYLVMPWIEGGSLQDRLEESGPVPWEEAVRIVAEAAETLQSAHESGVVHSDIKPANLLVAANGGVLVADFGIARLADFSQTQTRSVALTPHYAAPELIAGEAPTQATDVYGLGATLYALIEGHPPYETDGDLVALADVISSEDAPALNIEVPEPVLESYVRSMAKSPKDRFGSAADFAQALRGASVDPSPRPRSGSRPHARAWFLAAASVALLVILGSGFVVNRIGASNGSDSVAPVTTTLTTISMTNPQVVVTSAPLNPTTVVSTTAVATTVPPPPAIVEIFEAAEIREIPLQGALRSPQYDDGVVWVTRDDGDGRASVARIDANSGAVIETIPVGTAPRGPVFVDGSAWIFGAADGELARLGTGGEGVVETIRVTRDREPSGSTAGRDLDQPIVAADDRIWVAARMTDETLVSVTATSPDTGKVEKIDVALLTAAAPVATETDVWIPGAAVCHDNSRTWTPFADQLPEYEKLYRRLDELGAPVQTSCQVVVRIDLVTGQPSAPVVLQVPDGDLEWMDPDSSVWNTYCTASGSDCVVRKGPAMDVYMNKAERIRESRRSSWPGIGERPVTFGRDLLWADGWGGIYSMAESGAVVGVYGCRDGSSGWSTASAVGDILWIWQDSVGLCALDLARPIDFSDTCGADFACNLRLEESGLPVFVAAGLPAELEIIPAVVPSGYGSSVWVAGLDGRLLLVDYVSGEATDSVKILLEFDIGPGIAVPLVTPDGSVWAAGKGRLTRISPDLTPAEYVQIAAGD